MINRILSFLFLIACCSCNNRLERIKALTTTENIQQDQASDVQFIYSEGARTKAVMHAGSFLRNSNALPPYVDMKGGIRVEFFNDSTRKIESTLTAKYARYYENEGNVLLRDSIVVKNKRGDVLRTQELVWNQNIEKFFTEKPVSILTPTQTLFGDGMEANQNFTWYKIQNLRGTMLMEK